jgi:hypothetical protein
LEILTVFSFHYTPFGRFGQFGPISCPPTACEARHQVRKPKLVSGVLSQALAALASVSTCRGCQRDFGELSRAVGASIAVAGSGSRNLFRRSRRGRQRVGASTSAVGSGSRNLFRGSRRGRQRVGASTSAAGSGSRNLFRRSRQRRQQVGASTSAPGVGAWAGCHGTPRFAGGLKSTGWLRVWMIRDRM